MEVLYIHLSRFWVLLQSYLFLLLYVMVAQVICATITLQHFATRLLTVVSHILLVKTFTSSSCIMGKTQISQTKMKLTWTVVWTQAFLRGALLIDGLPQYFSKIVHSKDQLNPPLSKDAFLLTGSSSHSSHSSLIKSGSLSQSEITEGRDAEH